MKKIVSDTTTQAAVWSENCSLIFYPTASKNLRLRATSVTGMLTKIICGMGDLLIPSNPAKH
jgi:hypothetical protein